MKFVWNVNFVEGYENSHSIVVDNEETTIESVPFTVNLYKDDNTPLLNSNDAINLVYYVDGVEYTFDNDDTINPCISGDFPDGIKLTKNNDFKYTFSGTLPQVKQESIAYFTLRVRVDITESLLERLPEEERNNLEGKEYIYDDYFMSFIIKNKKIKIDTKETYEFIETLYTKYQIKLINGNGDEEFVKLSGVLPTGINLSNNGLLYGIAYDNNNEFTEDADAKRVSCKIGLKKNGELIKDEDGNIIEAEFKSRVKKLEEENDPIWITDSGQIASIKFGDIISGEIFVKAYDPKGRKITYSLVDGYVLPTGLTLNNSTGQIFGTCSAKDRKIWNFKINVSNGLKTIERAFNIETNKISSDKFIHWITDANLGNYKIGENVFFNIKAESGDKLYKINYTLISNTLPKGLTFNNGLFYGKVKYQELKKYDIVIEATNGYDTVQRKFYMTLKEGLGNNAVNCYFYINHEYDDDYAEMLSYFNKANAYEPKNSLYRINSVPQIDICECNCFDIQLMKYLLEFNDSLNITWGNTIRKDYFNGDNLLYTTFYKSIEEEVPTGSIQKWGGDRIYVTKSSNSSTGYYLEGTTTEVNTKGSHIYTDSDSIIEGQSYIYFKGKKTYIKILTPDYWYIISSNKVLNGDEVIYTENYEEYNPYTFENEIKQRKYVLIDDVKEYIAQCDNGMIENSETNTYLGIYVSEDLNIMKDPDILRKYFIDDKNTIMYVPSTNEIRKALSTQIYVTKSDNEHIYYDPGSQEIISESDFENKYIVYYDDEKESYYVKYNGENVYIDVYSSEKVSDSEYENITPAYALIENENWVEKIDNKDASQTEFDDTWDNKYAETEYFYRTIDGNETKYILKPVKLLVEQLDTEVDYKNYLIFEKGTENLQENILFTLSWNPYTSFIIINGKTHIVKEISKPWIYEPGLNTHMTFDKRIVLPYINDEDVRKGGRGTYIRFFDIDNESIPEWKTRTILNYTADNYYYPGDIFRDIRNDTVTYYKVTKMFKSGDDATKYIGKYTVVLSDEEVESLLKAYYYPALPLFYAKPYTEYGDKGSILPNGMDSDESKGKLLTGRKFCFFEVHFSPIYNNNIDNFTIDFYNHNNERSPEFQLI